MLFEAALARAGFMPVAQAVREYKERKWTETEHNLDRVFERDGVAYGAEVKNTLRYIDAKEFSIKLRMCEWLGLRPLFIVRMMPKVYNWTVIKNGGFSLIFEYQLYPFGSEEMARMIRTRLGLPVDCPSAIQVGTVQRLLNWQGTNSGCEFEFKFTHRDR